MLCEHLPGPVYFLFALETAQTALTGADACYWFIQGFGDFDRLFAVHYIPIDVAIMGSVISLVVQMYFCYRIWTLTRNLWLCVVISIVCVPDLPRVCQALNTLT